MRLPAQVAAERPHRDGKRLFLPTYAGGPRRPAPATGGRPRKINIRAVLNAIFYLLRTGCQWRLLPREFPGWSTVYHYSPSLVERWCLDLHPALNVPAIADSMRTSA